MAYDQITIQSMSFRVPVRYKEGDTLKANEASALNQTFWENLRNNFANKVRDGLEAGVPHETLQQQLDDYAAEYQFGVRTGGGGRTGDPVMTTAMNIAREMVRMVVKRQGLDPEVWNASRVTQAAKQLLDQQGADGRIMQTARKQVEEERKTATEAMTEVGEIVAATQEAAQ